ncbi:hypothetical protein [Micromonospora pisi]|nr:hypothetical protein [Micromonospora pisi]
MTDPTLPRVYVTVPGVESLSTVVHLLYLAGAQGTGERREFAVTGPLTAAQTAATWQLGEYVDSGTEGNRLDVRVEPAGELRAALDAMCPGWSPDDYDPAPAHKLNTGDWWGRRGRNPQPVDPPAAVPAPPVIPAPREDGMCCGEGKPWAPKPGEPPVSGCQLCPNSLTYWRRGRTEMPV